MSRKHTFIDSDFGGKDYDPSDKGTFTKGMVFVIMPFSGRDMDDVYSAIKDECKRLRLKATRVDEQIGSEVVIKKTAKMIEAAEFIICDLTRGRPNVYYEIGYAHGVGNEGSEILLIAKEGTELHFDIAPLQVRYYRNTKHLREILNQSLKGMIRVTRK